MIDRAIGTTLLIIAFAALSGVAPANESLLPPEPNWSGSSESLIRDADDPWASPSERTGLTETSDYQQSIAWLNRLVEASPMLHMESIGKSHENRDIWMVMASSDGGMVSASGTARDKPVLLVHAGIHAGEIDGKDAGFMLLRDIAFNPASAKLLDQVDMLFIPILNPDGHERRSAYARPNQRGPRVMGWRTNARNQNLNRDFSKLETPEIQALVKTLNQWSPDLYLDIHVTDGVDYQYDITFGSNGRNSWSPAISEWIEDSYRPTVEANLRMSGHVPGDLIFATNGKDLADGRQAWISEPRYSDGYGDARHLPAILVENHSLKSYKRRVLGTYKLIEASLIALANGQTELTRAIEEDKSRRAETIHLSFGENLADAWIEKDFLGIRSEEYIGDITGAPWVRWTGEPVSIDIKVTPVNKPLASVIRPDAYLLPPAWSDIADKLKHHGIEVQVLGEPQTHDVEQYTLPEAQLAAPAAWTPNPFEGRSRIDPGKPTTRRVQKAFPAGTFEISTDQPLGNLAILLLEPQSPDSFFQWGYFMEILNRTEYGEGYLLEPLAKEMLQRNPGLKQEFAARKSSDNQFSNNPRAQLMWFYVRSPYYDQQHLVYPVSRLME